MSLSCGGQMAINQNIKEKKVEKLKMLHKLQRTQQLILRGEPGQAYNLVNEVVVDLLDERFKEKAKPQEHKHTYGSTYE